MLIQRPYEWPVGGAESPELVSLLTKLQETTKISAVTDLTEDKNEF